MRKDEIPAQESGPTASGFNGEELAAGFRRRRRRRRAPRGAPAAGRRRMPRGRPESGRVRDAEAGFRAADARHVRASFPAYPLTFTYVGEAEAPQGKADVLDAKGPNNFTLRLFINSETHLPIMVSWTPPAPAGRGMPPEWARPPAPGCAGHRRAAGRRPVGAQRSRASAARRRRCRPAGAAAPPAGAPAGRSGCATPVARGTRGRPAAAGPPTPVENRLYFADYRDVDGMQLPFRLRRAVGRGHHRRNDVRPLQESTRRSIRRSSRFANGNKDQR